MYETFSPSKIISRVLLGDRLIFKLNRPYGTPNCFFQALDEKQRVDNQVVERMRNHGLLFLDPTSGICSCSKLAKALGGVAGFFPQRG